MIIGSFCIIAVLLIVATAAYLLIPLPLLSYQQGRVSTDYGEVTKIRILRPGVFEIGLRQSFEIDSRLQEGPVKTQSASSTRFFLFRKGQTLPNLGDKITISSINRMHHFYSSSFNWAKGWEYLIGAVPSAGVLAPNGVILQATPA